MSTLVLDDMELIYYWIAVITLIPVFCGSIITKIIDYWIKCALNKENEEHHFDEQREEWGQVFNLDIANDRDELERAMGVEPTTFSLGS
jgi:hypothetical protein